MDSKINVKGTVLKCQGDGSCDNIGSGIAI